MTAYATRDIHGKAEKGTDVLDVVVVEELPVVREGLRVLLRSEDVRVVETATTLVQATSAVGRHSPAAALVGVGRDREAAFAIAKAISGAARPSYVLLYADADQGIDLVEALSRGAAGVASRAAPITRLAEALRAVAAGRVWAEADIATPVGPVGGVRSSRLSRRELDVLAAMASGLSTEEVGEALAVTPHTARTHVRNALKKLGARSRAHAVAIALSEGAIEVNP